MAKSDIITDHHICAKVRGGARNEPENIKELGLKVHRNLHNLFGVQLPHEQLEMVIDIARTALSPGFHRDITDVIKCYKDQHYKPWIFDEKSGIYVPR